MNILKTFMTLALCLYLLCSFAQNCPNNLVQNGNFESGTPTTNHQDINLADGWGSIWSGGSTGDYYNTGMNLPANLLSPLPASNEDYGAFWCNNNSNQTFREGIMNTLSTPIPSDSEQYDLSFKIACLGFYLNNPPLCIYGASTPSLATGQTPTSNVLLNIDMFPLTVELGQVIIPPTCDENFQTYNLTFDASIIPAGESINHIFFTRCDDHSNGFFRVFLALDDVCLTLNQQLEVNLNAEDQIICEDECTILTTEVNGASGVSAFSWDDNSLPTDGLPITICPTETTTYSVTVTDDMGSIATDVITITVNELPTTTINAASDNCGNCEGTAQAFSVGNAPFTYNWDGQIGGSSGTSQSNLCAGTYGLTVSDNLGCSSSSTFEIIGATTASIAIQLDNNVSCAGENNGQASVEILSGGTPPFNYNWTNGETTSTANMLPVGQAIVTITDANNCMYTESTIIQEPLELISAIQSTNIPCDGITLGSAVVNTSGGTAPYFYTWSNGATTNNIENLDPDTYSVTITDTQGCTNIETITITEPTPISFDITTNNISCFGEADGQIEITNIVGGTTPYFFSWNNGETTPSIENLEADSYSLTITDAQGCPYSLSAIITEPAPISYDITTSNISCFGENNGQAFIEVLSGGTPPFSYDWMNGETTSSPSMLPAGQVLATITDANGCEYIESILIEEPLELISSIQSTNISCDGTTLGSAIVSTSGGTAPYIYAWDNGATTTSIEDLVADTYSVTITDAQGCSNISMSTITEPTPITFEINATNISCFGEADGQLEITNIVGGSPPYLISINGSPFVNNTIFQYLDAMDYELTIQDVNGCENTNTISINEPQPLVVSLGDDVTINLGESYDIEVQHSNSSNYNLTWSNEDFTCIDSINGNCEYLSVTPTDEVTYSVTMMDENACTATDEITIFINKDRNVFIPNTFTPNGDGFNDFFTVYGNDAIKQVTLLRIFSRWGDFVYENSNFSPNDELEGWNGLFRDKPVQSGIYTYYTYIEFIDGEEVLYKGDLLVID